MRLVMYRATKPTSAVIYIVIFVIGLDTSLGCWTLAGSDLMWMETS